ncbi:PEMT [Bugula neritina]|uniref:Phosphatidylethanolamine N-methyltransferase n=1 Tax=Bugula neritina TaxID=10212 RepID=A0A7J7JJ53_BUGNE|nr:PEMT [Bugula neritina]
MAEVNPSSWSYPTSFKELYTYVNIYDTNIHIFLVLMWAPVFFNVILRTEHRTRFLTKLFGSPELACVALSIPQFLFITIFRFICFTKIVTAHPRIETPFNEYLEYLETGLWLIGTTLVLSSSYRLGWIGLWHGDHFGILFSEKLTGFPFDVCDHPMYTGSKINYIAYIIGNRSIVGALLFCVLLLVYVVNEGLEGRFTEMIYAERAASKANGSKKVK